MTQNKLPSVLLRAGEDRRVRAGHPWAFSNEILMDAETRAIPPGSLAILRAPGGEALGLVTFNPHSLIAARLVTSNPEAIVASGTGVGQPESLDDWRRWRSIAAVAQDNLFFVPPPLIQRHTPRFLDGVERLCRQLETARARRPQ